MLPVDLEQYLHENIPLSKAMGVSVVSVEGDAVIVRAPLEPNVNHRGTVFGGSASALALLAAWSLLHVRLRREGIASHLVVRRNTMDYEKPILGAFTARSQLEQPAEWSRFADALLRKGKARISVVAVLEQAGQVVGRLTGEFAVLAANGAGSGA